MRRTAGARLHITPTPMSIQLWLKQRLSIQAIILNQFNRFASASQEHRNLVVWDGFTHVAVQFISTYLPFAREDVNWGASCLFCEPRSAWFGNTALIVTILIQRD
jgi:hypothetical protein